MLKDKELIQSINKNISKITLLGNTLISKYKISKKMSSRDYIYSVLSLDICHRVKDIIILHKKHKYDQNGFDSSIYVISRSIVETYIYFKYLLSEKNKLDIRFDAFKYHSTKENEIKIFTSLKRLGVENNKFVFDNDKNHILSLRMIESKIEEWNDDVTSIKSKYTDDDFKKEVEILKKIDRVAKAYDDELLINSVTGGEENKSMEWIYNYVYRFQCMSAHQSLRDKEKIFNFDNTNCDNDAVLGLLEDLTRDILEIYENDLL